MNLGTETDLQPVPFRYFLDETGRGEGGQGEEEDGGENLSRSRQCKTTRAIEGQKPDNFFDSTLTYLIVDTTTMIPSFVVLSAKCGSRSSFNARERNKIENKIVSLLRKKKKYFRSNIVSILILIEKNRLLTKLSK